MDVMSVPHRNADGAFGQRCAECSGLGSLLRIGTTVTKAAARCNRCGGSGIDPSASMEIRLASQDAAIAALSAQVAELVAEVRGGRS